MSSPIILNKLKSFFLPAGIIETSCFPFLACVTKDCEFKVFASCTVLFFTFLSLEILCNASSF